MRLVIYVNLKMPKVKSGVTYKKNYSNDDMLNAIAAVRSGSSVYSTSKKYIIPYNTLKLQVKRANLGEIGRLGAGTHFSPVEETELNQWSNMCQSLGYPRSWDQIRYAASLICKFNHP